MDEPGDQLPPEPARAPEPAASVPPPIAVARRGGRRWLLMLVVAVLAVALDQGSKHWARQTLLPEHGGRLELVEDRLAFSYVQNPGAAWGLLSGRSPQFRLPFFLAISVLALAFVFTLYARLEPGQRLAMLALALVAGGALGNVIDRLRFNYVVDFIELTLTRSFKWPTFNVADIAISSGVALIFLEMILAGRAERRRRAAAAAAAAERAATDDVAGPPR